MIIESANFKNLNGHLNPSLSFARNVNVIIGINGSGKTSILNAIVWTLDPSSLQAGYPAAYLLANLMFDEIVIRYSLGDQSSQRSVTAERTQENIVICVDTISETLVIPVAENPDLVWFATGQTEEQKMEFFRRYMEDQQTNAVVRHLSHLPGPLYLPLNRRWGEILPASRGPQIGQVNFANQIPIATVLAQVTRGRQLEMLKEKSLNETLRNNLLTALFDASELGTGDRVLTPEELQELRRRVGAALENLGLAEAHDLSEKLFKELEDPAEMFGGHEVPENFVDDDNFDFWLTWIIRTSPISTRLRRLMPLIEEYETDIVSATERSTGFLQSVNKFLSDNGKRLRFSDDSSLMVDLPNGQTISSQNLASGELQLLALFAFLWFGLGDSGQQFPVLVDEPELSLHIAWQNRYVREITSANPNAQFILATHSPEIAAPAQDNIIDISPV